MSDRRLDAAGDRPGILCPVRRRTQLRIQGQGLCQAAKADASGKQVVSVCINIEKGWHLYANPVKNETLEPTQTVVTIKSKNSAFKPRIVYPVGKLQEDKLVGNYYVYEDKVDIQAEVNRTPDDGPLEIEVKVNACTKKTCLRGSTIKLTVP